MISAQTVSQQINCQRADFDCRGSPQAFNDMTGTLLFIPCKTVPWVRLQLSNGKLTQIRFGPRKDHSFMHSRFLLLHQNRVTVAVPV
jgi:hypothetical protein